MTMAMAMAMTMMRIMMMTTIMKMMSMMTTMKMTTTTILVMLMMHMRTLLETMRMTMLTTLLASVILPPLLLSCVCVLPGFQAFGGARPRSPMVGPGLREPPGGPQERSNSAHDGLQSSQGACKTPQVQPKSTSRPLRCPPTA